MRNPVPIPPPIRLEECREFFQELMNPEAFSNETRQAIEENDPAIFGLLLTRTLYLYAYGSYRNEVLTPPFLNARARGQIEQLRLRTDVTPEICQAIEVRLRDHFHFNEVDGQTNEAIRTLIESGYRLLQGNNDFFRLIGEYQANPQVAA